MTTRGPILAAVGDTADASIYVQQEGAYVHVSIESGPEGKEIRNDALLTPDLAEAMSYALSEEAKNARGFAS